MAWAFSTESGRPCLPPVSQSVHDRICHLGKKGRFRFPLDGHGGLKVICVAHHFEQCWFYELFKGDHRGRGASRESENEIVVDFTEYRWLPGFPSRDESFMSIPNEAKVSWTRSYLPLDMPPEVIMTSAQSASDRCDCRVSSSSLTMPMQSGTAPVSSTCAARE